MISIVIRNKDQAIALDFLLKNLTERYKNDFEEIIIIDNLSTDNSREIAKKYKVRFETIENFSYGGSANFAAKKAKFPIVVIFSAHSYPVSHDFFKLILKKFDKNENLAGLRCLHSSNDFKNYINKIPAKEDPNRSGLIFSGSAFNKKVWVNHPFREDVSTFEDKEWSKRVLEKGYEIEFVESIFSYEIKRNRQQNYFRFKNDLIGNYQLWNEDVSFLSASKGFLVSLFRIIKDFFGELRYAILRFTYLIKFILNKPDKF
jgi:glycosyltransferase involved in cell wall biosynthesis